MPKYTISLIKRIINWAKKPTREKVRLIKYRTTQLFAIKKNELSRWSLLLGPDNQIFIRYRQTHSLYLTYQPDSHQSANQHPEFSVLYSKFISNNLINNGGDLTRLWSLILNIKHTLLNDNVAGDFAELGVWRGNTASVLAHYAVAFNRTAYLFDTFEGFDTQDLVGIDAHQPKVFSDTSLALVREVIGEDMCACKVIVGHFPSSIKSEPISTLFSVVSLDCDLYEPMKAGLEFFYPRLSPGGIFLLHDYSSGQWGGAKKAIDEFCRETGNTTVLMPDKSGSAFMRKKI